MRVQASRRARSYIRRRGGVLHLWLDESGLLSYAVGGRGAADVPYRRHDGPGFALLLQKGVKLGEWVRVERNPLPPWRLAIGFELLQVRGQATGAGFG